MPPGLLMWTITALTFELGEAFQRLGALAAAADKPFDVHPRDPPAGAGDGAAIAERQARADHRDDDNEYRHDAPECQLAPHAAAIDDEIGIERHGVISSELIRNAL